MTTFRDLKNLISTLSEDQLDQKFISSTDDFYIQGSINIETLEEDLFFMNKEDNTLYTEEDLINFQILKKQKVEASKGSIFLEIF